MFILTMIYIFICLYICAEYKDEMEELITSRFLYACENYINIYLPQSAMLFHSLLSKKINFFLKSFQALKNVKHFM